MPDRAGPSRRRHTVLPTNVWQPWNSQELRRDGGPNYIGNTLLPASRVAVPQSGALPDFPWKPVLVDLTRCADTRTIGTQTDLVLGTAELGPLPAVAPEPLALRLLHRNRAPENVVRRVRYPRHAERPYDVGPRPLRAVCPMVAGTASQDGGPAFPLPPLTRAPPSAAPQVTAPAQGMTPLFQLEAMYPALSPQVARYYPERWF